MKNFIIKYVISMCFLIAIGVMCVIDSAKPISIKDEENLSVVASSEEERKEETLNFYREQVSQGNYVKINTSKLSDENEFYSVPIEDKDELLLIYTDKNGKVFKNKEYIGDLHYNNNSPIEIPIWSGLEYTVTYNVLLSKIRIHQYGFAINEKNIQGEFFLRTNMGYVFKKDDSIYLYRVIYNGLSYCFIENFLASNVKNVLGDFFYKNGCSLLVEMGNGELRAYEGDANNTYHIIKDIDEGKIIDKFEANSKQMLAIGYFNNIKFGSYIQKYYYKNHTNHTNNCLQIYNDMI